MINSSIRLDFLERVYCENGNADYGKRKKNILLSKTVSEAEDILLYGKRILL